MNTNRCHLCDNPCPDNSWWSEGGDKTCQDCWAAGDELITLPSIEAMKPAIELPLEDFYAHNDFFLLGEDYDFLRIDCAEAPEV